MKTKGQFGEASLNGLTADPQEESVIDPAEVDADAPGDPGRGKHVFASLSTKPTWMGSVSSAAKLTSTTGRSGCWPRRDSGSSAKR